MGEQPIFTTKAHVFQIDPATKKKWLPASSQSVNVSYYFDSNRDTYRIISVEGTKAVINSTISPNMSFTKTSQKFGQWSDPRANTVYGLGFSSEADCTKFVDKFKEVKELTRQAANKSSPPTTNGSNSPAPATPPANHAPPQIPTNHITAVAGSPDVASSPVMNVPKPVVLQNDNNRVNSGGSGVVDQLKYENDRLKIALAQSSANAKKWEVELQTLKNNNARLTTALQESNSNVEEWKKQLAMYKEESAKMKKKMLDMEKMGGSELFQRQIVELREKIQDMERANQAKQDEIHELNKRMGEVKVLETKNAQLQGKIQEGDKEKESLRRQLTDLREQLDVAKSQSIRDKQQLRGVQETFGTKINELYELNDKLAELMQT